MFENINEYIKGSLSDRQYHLKLDEDCIEIGSNSSQCRALLAHTLKTTIPKGQKINLCHACHNGNCSNSNHLYWGTSSENLKDAIESGVNKSPYHHLVDKHGKEAVGQMLSERAKNNLNFLKSGGGHNKLDQEKVEDFKQKIIESKPLEYGWVKRASESLNISHTQVKRFVKKYCKDVKTYQRQTKKMGN